MTAVLILMVIFAGVMGIVYVDNTTKRGRALPPGGRPARPEPGAAPALPAPIPDAAETLALRLPEPARAQAWALLCRVADALGAEGSDARTSFLLTQTREHYLPETLRAYLHLTPEARGTLLRQGQPAEVLLHEQLTLLDDGVREAVRRDHAAADRLLTQGRFLRERFGSEGHELRLPGGEP
ncbi:hypothetical protein [Deinococcus arcticus]|uniref:Uncharacterized protein n=1 Tax=Deinococcus arcticus TaxID=2136176 RepID=A0A2T3WD44_9DEIO|nr:hypothetical protein [Deinococcus arcticus]PTA69818.1 hypothetical protein C8263_02070 [Deinococcus arcticus]